MSNELDVEKLPQATHSGVLNLGGVGIECAVLEDDVRVLTQEGFLHSIGRARKAKGGQGATTVDSPPAFLAAKNLQPYAERIISQSITPILFRTDTGQRAYGYKAELLPEVCEVFLQAREDNALVASQLHIAQQCEILIRGLARIGIIALVDEATGFQYDRARTALEEILEKFITDELQRWYKTFPDDYYIEMYRLKGWKFDEVVPKKRPHVVGWITNDIVYQRLAPGVLTRLKELTPRDEKGRHTEHFHRRLTSDHGHPALKEHLHAVVTLMKASSNWNQFMRLLDKSLPKLNAPEPLFYPDEYGVGVDTEPGITKSEFTKALGKASRPSS